MKTYCGLCLALLIALLAFFACGDEEFITNFFHEYQGESDDYDPGSGITGGFGSFNFLMDSGVVLRIDSPGEGGELAGNEQVHFTLEGTEEITPNRYRNAYLIIDGRLDTANSPVISVFNTTETEHSVNVNTYTLRNGTHTLQILLWVYVGGANRYILGDYVTVEVANEYLEVLNVPDPVGDANGLFGDLSQPPGNGADGTYLDGIQDITNMRAQVAGANLMIILSMDVISTAWNPANGFDHVSFHIYLQDPSQPTDAAFLPRQNAQLPEGMDWWNYKVFAFGWGDNIFSSANATESFFGNSVGSPDIFVDYDANEIGFIVYGDSLGNPASLNGWKIYVTTFDFDGITTDFRQIAPVSNSMRDHQFRSDRLDFFDGSGSYTNAIIMDHAGPATISY